MTGFRIDLETQTLENPHYRQVLFTAPHLQLVVMTLQPGEEIGMERHEGGDQFIRVEAGEGEAVLDGQRHRLSDGVAIVIPAGCEHNVVNTSRNAPLRLYSVYAPPEHPDGTLHRSKADADAYEMEQHGAK
jgi:mannose-6-phosphate isomerase-like protein (cupin superfamily)